MRHFKTLLLSLLLCCIAYLSCKKDDPPAPQLVKGTVLDKKTGKPVPEAEVMLLFTDLKRDPLNPQVWKLTNSNYKGEFEYRDSTGLNYVNISYIYKSGYLKCYSSGCGTYVDGPTDSIIAEITPLDGVIDFEIKNVTGEHEEIYVWFSYQSLIDASEGGIKTNIIQPHPLELENGQQFSQFVTLPSEEPIYTFWKFHKGSSPDLPIYSDTITIQKTDTMIFVIEF